jgi:hypothetical protein
MWLEGADGPRFNQIMWTEKSPGPKLTTFDSGRSS